MRIGWIIAATLLLVPPAAALAAGDACTLITDAQVSSTLGAPTDPGARIGNLATSCQWIGKGKYATLTANNTIAGKTALERFEPGKRGLPGITVEPVSGVGDDAYYVYFSGTSRAGLGLVVKKGNSAFEVRVYGFEIDKGKPVAKALAQIIAGKL